MAISSQLGSSALLPAGLGFRNKIINGDMRINQRGTSTSTANGGYLVDRWVMFSGTSNISINTSTDAPDGFTNSIYAECTSTTTSSYHGIAQYIEGNNVADLGYGVSWAKPVVLSFWVKSTKTGIANISLKNSNNTRAYITEYTINSVNTWEKKTIHINGDTTNTGWDKTTGIGLKLWWDLGSGSSYNASANVWSGGDFIRTSSQTHNLTTTLNARLYITGVQLEQNYQPTPFEQRPIGVELGLCQRYFATTANAGTFGALAYGGAGLYNYHNSATTCADTIQFPTQMRATPTMDFAGWTTTNLGLSLNGTFSGHMPGIGDRTVNINYLTRDGVSFYSDTSATGYLFFLWRANAEL